MTIYAQLSEEIEHSATERITQWAQRVLDDIVSGSHSVTAVSHPLGFLCLPVHRLGDEGVCIHLWGPDRHRASPTTSPMHCHSWELLSFVLSGEVLNQTIRLIDDAESPTHQVFEVHSGAAGDEIRATRRLVRPEVATSLTHRAGERYRLPAGIFHQTFVPDSQDLVVTVVLGMTRAGVVDLSLGELHTTGHHVRRELCGRPATVQAAEAARVAIDAQRAVSSSG